MKKLSSILSIVRKSQLLISFLMMSLVFPQQAVSLPSDETEQVDIGDEKNTEAEGEQSESFVLESFSMVTPASQSHIHHVFYEIMDIEYEVEQDFKDFQSFEEPESYLKILLGQVISPNAP